MNRAQFIDMLRDYLAQYFAKDEAEDIVRDYEEYFEAGIEAGKTEESIAVTLGSPKEIVRQLREEMQSKRLEDGNGTWSGAISRTCTKITNWGKAVYHEAATMTKEYMRTDGEKHMSTLERVLRQLFRIGVRIGGFLLFLIIGFWMLVAAAVGVAFSTATIVGLVFSFTFLPVAPAVVSTGIFIALFMTGALILFWQLWTLVYRYARGWHKHYRNFLAYRVNGGETHE
ncbi:MAG: DUF1700 domain-containing protein [Bacilli bacterium]